jgi:16S rRNA (adenine1518-N6/adenine1519-N6)-dimethyltransferase
MEKLRPKKALGQNFLTDRNVISRIVQSAGISAGERVMEVGPGRGAMTSLLADSGACVLAIELDRQLVPLLEREFDAYGNVEILQADILAADLKEILSSRHLGKWKVAANLPYNISSQVLIKFLDNRELFSRLVLMLQREVGERMIAPHGCKEYGILTVYLRLHYDIYREFIVKPGSFHPVPKVDSVVLRLEPLPAPRADVGDEAFFRGVVRAAFAQRRKTLWNCLRAAALAADEKGLREALACCGIDGGRRGESLSLDEFASLSRALIKVTRVKDDLRLNAVP